MAALLRINIPDPQNVLDTYGALAKYRIERDTTSAMTTASEITSGTVVAGTTEYEVQDADGIAGTHWYRVRYSKATPSLPADLSGYGPVFQAGSAWEFTNLERVRLHAGIAATDTDSDPVLAVYVSATNEELMTRLGFWPGSSPDTTRTYDAVDAVRDGTRLYIPGGIRTFTTAEVSVDGSTWTAITSDVRVGPAVHLRRSGRPGGYIEFKPYTTVASTFDGWNYVRITGTAFATFGGDDVMANLEKLGDMIVLRMWHDRQAGTLASPTPSKFIYPDDDHLLRSLRAEHFAMVG